MCTIIPGENCQCGQSSGGGPGVESVAVVVALTAAVSLTYQVFAKAPYFFLFGLYPAVVLVATSRGRRLLRWLLRAAVAGVAGVSMAVAWYRRRRAQAAPKATAVALPQAYRATVYLALPDGTNRVLRGPGDVPGTWTSKQAVEAELRERWLAVHGAPKVGKIGCSAYPVKEPV
jgi:hypothetical protein